MLVRFEYDTDATDKQELQEKLLQIKEIEKLLEHNSAADIEAEKRKRRDENERWLRMAERESGEYYW